MRGVARMALALLLVSGGWIGLAQGDAPVDAAPPRAMQAGDAATYRLTLDGPWRGEPGDATWSISLGWPTDVAVADGSLQRALPAAVTGPSTTMRPDLPGEPSWRTIDQEWWLGEEVLVRRQVEQDATGWSETTELSTFHHCLVHPATPCSWPSLHLQWDGTTSTGWDTVDGMRLLRMDGGDAVWWFAPGMPWPLQMRLQADDRMVTAKLVGWSPGDGPGAAASSQQGPPWTTHPWDGQALHDGDAEHPFRLSSAISAAQRAHEPLRDWWQDHPDAHVFMASHAVEHDDAETRRAWDIHLSDGQEGISVRVVQHTPHAPGLLSNQHLRYHTTAPHGDALAPAAPAREDLPDRMPDVATLMAHWDRLVGAEATGWGFRILDGRDGPDVKVAVADVQRLRWGVDGVLIDLRGHRNDATVLVFDAEQAVRIERASHGTPEALAPAPTVGAAPDLAGYAHSTWSSDVAGGLGWLTIAGAALLLPWKLLAPLFTRIVPARLLDHPARRAIHDAVEAEPGIHFRAICDRLGESPGRVRHHVRKLVDGGLLRARQVPGYTVYVPADLAHRAVLDAAPLARAPGARALVAALLDGEMSSGEAARAADLSPSTASYHLGRLRKAGIVTTRRDGRSRLVALSTDGRLAVEGLGLVGLKP